MRRVLTWNSCQNAAAQSCTLLQLPAELRLKIFSHALGGNLLHIQRLSPFAQSLLQKKGLYAGGCNGFYNEICSLDQAEDDAHHHFWDHKSDKKRKTPFYNSKTQQDLGHDYYAEAWSTRHLSCTTEPASTRADELDAWTQAERLDLALLRVCKQVYREARMLPYSTNTFAFNSAQSFQEFALVRKPHELKAMNHLNLVISIGTAPFSEARSRDWVYALHFCNTGRLIKSLKSLDLCIELYDISILDTRADYKKMEFRQLIEEVQAPFPLLTKTSWIEQFAELCRQSSCKVRLTIADDALSSWGIIGKRLYCRDMRIRDEEWVARRARMCLTLKEKREFAQRLAALLRLERTALYVDLHESAESPEVDT